MQNIKIFISQPMYGIPLREIYLKRQQIIARVKKYVENVFDVNLIEPSEVPDNVGRLWYLGNSIMMMDNCDLIIFCDGWNKANGCCIEHEIVQKYNLNYIMEKDIENYFENERNED